ncbi:uncharacterized protein LOC124898493 [Capsicum annuum]|uniref:uncharacterized protein LOC124898493 n=1 Tax=Capsicum annuum TaxID=4072 RepID=UPI001FB123DC|nr:uncharacterized protein LOC124898493 [Capsicum annuum]
MYGDYHSDSVGKSVENKVSIDEPEESSAVESEKLDGFVDISEKEDEKEEEVKKVDEPKFGKFMAMLKQLKINVPLVEELEKMPGYAKLMKGLITKKRKVSSDQVENLNYFRAVSTQFIVQKKADPGVFTILCKVGSLDVAKALCDLGASMNLMPLAVCKKLGLEDPTPTNMRLVMEDRSIKQPVGISHDVLVKVVDFILSSDFVVLYCDVDFEVPIILGRPLLATGRVIVDMELNKLKFRLGKKEIKSSIRYSKIPLKRKSPTEPKKAAKDDVYRKLLNEESDYEEEKPLLRKLKMKQSPKKTPLPLPIEVEDSDDTESTIASEQEGSKKGESEQHESEHDKADEEDQEESEKFEFEGTASGSPSTEQQDNKESPPRRALIKCKNPKVRNNARWKIPRAEDIYIAKF